MKPIKVALCDDNQQERKFFYETCKLIKERKGLAIKIKEYESGDSLLFDMQDSRIMTTVDLVLLDIHMPGSHGIQVAQSLRDYGYQGSIIFTTKSEEHWRQAFDVEAFNYITKDADMENRFVDIFMKAVKKATDRRGRSLIFSAIGEVRKIEVASISHFEAFGHMVTVHYGKNEQFKFTSSLTKLESLLLDNVNFVRIHRSYLISLPYVVKIDEKAKYVLMENGENIPVSNKNMKTLKATMLRGEQ